MKILNSIKVRIANPYTDCIKILNKLSPILSDKVFVSLYYRFKMKRKLNLRRPVTLNEKLNWLKIYDHNPLYTKLVDKYEVKKWVADKIGCQYIIPTLEIWDSPEQINWEKLPNQFVLKTTHGGGGDGIVICVDKDNFDIEKNMEQLNIAMKTDPYKRFREWPYKDVKHRIIAEKFMQDGESITLQDYKFHCFYGEPRFILVCKDRFEDTGITEDFFDCKWNHLPVKRPGIDWSKTEIQAPEHLEQMLEISRKLSEGIPFVRVDLYSINNKIYFGEMTFFPSGGKTPFEPESWDTTFGNWLKLPLNQE